MSHSSPCLTSLVNGLPCEGTSALGFMRVYRMAPVIRRFFRWVRTFTPGDWVSGSLAFTMMAGFNATGPTASLDRHVVVPACYCPVGLSASGKLVTQAPPSSTSRLHRVCNDAPHGAHPACSFQSTRLSSRCCLVAQVVLSSLWAFRISRTYSTLYTPPTCHPSPCRRLSRPPSTTVAPLP